MSQRIELTTAPGQVFDVDGPTLEDRAKELWDLPRWTPAPGRPGTWATNTGDNTRYSYTVDSTNEQQVQTVAVTFDVELQGDLVYFVAGPALKAGSLTAPDDDTGALWGLDVVDALSSGSVDTADGIATFAPSDELTAIALLNRDQSSLTLVFQPNQPTETLTPEPEPEPFVAEPGPTTEPSRVAPDTKQATTSSTSPAATGAEPVSSTTTAPAPTTSTSTPQAPTTSTPAAPTTLESFVSPGAFCSPTGATGKSKTGKSMICASTNKDGTPYDNGQSRWRQP